MAMIKYMAVIALTFISLMSASAHESRPVYIKVVQDSTATYFEITVPNTINIKNLPLIYLNDTFLNDDSQWMAYSAGFRQKWEVTDGLLLKGSQLKIKFPVFNPVLSTIIAITYDDDTEQVLIIPPDKDHAVIPIDAYAMEVRKQFSILGIEHIWAGIDHLLFLFCLIVISGYRKQLFFAVSGFTIAHSLTLILATLDFIRLPIALIESMIAMSIVFLCYEIIHHHERKGSLTYRYPILAASSFGLLHGMGFAAVLGEIALPTNHLLDALLFFNIGVEIGQIIFIFLLFIIAFIVDKLMDQLLKDELRSSMTTWGLRLTIYVVGILASYWMFDRIA